MTGKCVRAGKDARLKREGETGCPGKINLEPIIIPSIVTGQYLCHKSFFLRIDHFL